MRRNVCLRHRVYRHRHIPRHHQTEAHGYRRLVFLAQNASRSGVKLIGPLRRGSVLGKRRASGVAGSSVE